MELMITISNLYSKDIDKSMSLLDWWCRCCCRRLWYGADGWQSNSFAA